MSLTGQIYEEYQSEFIERCRLVEEGELSALDCAVKFKDEMDYLIALAEDRKAWLNENVDEVVNEADQFGKDGYKGLIFSKQVRETLSYKHIPEWVEVESKKKAIEEKSKAAYQQVKKGMMNVDENGEEITLPEVKTSSFIKADKVK